jgi:hypothetical protein
MLLSPVERRIVIASLQWAAMEHDKKADTHKIKGDRREEEKYRRFALECARLADQFSAAA